MANKFKFNSREEAAEAVKSEAARIGFDLRDLAPKHLKRSALLKAAVMYFAEERPDESEKGKKGA